MGSKVDQRATEGRRVSHRRSVIRPASLLAVTGLRTCGGLEAT